MIAEIEVMGLREAAVDAPFDPECEQAVLGALLLGVESDPVREAGGVSLFFDPVHAEVYRAIRKLEAQDAVVSPVTVGQLMNAEVFKDIGGKGYLAKLAGASIASFALVDYVGILAECAAKRDLLHVMQTAQQHLTMGDMPAAEIAGKIEAGLSHMETIQRKVQPTSMTAAVTSAMEQVYAAYQGTPLSGVSPAITALRRLVPILAPGELWLLGGRPAMGKTAVAMTMATAAARAGHPVVIASYEMLPEALAQRVISEATTDTQEAVTYKSMRMGDMSERQMQQVAAAADAVADLPIQFLPREYASTQLLPVGVKQALRRVGDTGKQPLLIVDYAQLMRGEGRSRYEQITDVSLTLKSLAMDQQMPVLALSQLSRAVEQRDDKRPMMSDLRESGQLEQDADGVMFCYRDEYYLQREQPDFHDIEEYSQWETNMERVRNRLEIIVAKQRQGEVGTAHMRFNPALNLIWED